MWTPLDGSADLDSILVKRDIPFIAIRLRYEDTTGVSTGTKYSKMHLAPVLLLYFSSHAHVNGMRTNLNANSDNTRRRRPQRRQDGAPNKEA